MSLNLIELRSWSRNWLLALVAVPLGNTSPKQQNIHAGEQIFVQKCFQCHSVVQDQVRLGPSLYSEMKRSPHKKTAAQVRSLMIDGKGKMPPFKDVLSKEDMDNLIAYIRAL